MLTRIKKAVLTKRIHKYQWQGRRVLRVEISDVVSPYSNEVTDFYACVTPGSENIYVNHIKPPLGPAVMSVTAFSDFIVRTNKYDYFLGVVENNLKEIVDANAGN